MRTTLILICQMKCPKDEQEFVLADRLGAGRLVKLEPAKRVCVPGY